MAGILLALPVTASGQAAALPAPPAFCSGSIDRIRNIDGDAFDFQRDDGKVVRIRLIDADCQGLGDRSRTSAKETASDLLTTQRVWVFPCGQSKTGEVYAHVWTSHGWLSDVLVCADSAARRGDPAPLGLAPVDPPGAPGKGQPPPAPAFASATFTVVEGDTYEVERAGQKVRVRLFDATCQDMDSVKRDDAKAEASRVAGQDGGRVWVFPCSPRWAKATDEPRVRIWTKQGWLSDALLKGGFANRYSDPDRGTVQVAAAQPAPVKHPEAVTRPAPSTGTTKDPPAPTPPPAPAVTPRPRPKSSGTAPSGSIGTWREVTVAKATSDGLSCETGVFKIPNDIWRITWDLKPTRVGGHILLNVYRVDEAWQTKMSSQHTAGVTGPSGVHVVRSKPGDYWVRITGSTSPGFKIESLEPPPPGK
jgi:endonuclease YncB( thermonuclease family)